MLMNWRSDAMASLFNCHENLDSQNTAARDLARSLFAVVRRTLFSTPNLISTPEIMKSLLSQVIEPSFALAQKVTKNRLPKISYISR
jgi:hypothetical protein